MKKPGPKKKGGSVAKASPESEEARKRALKAKPPKRDIKRSRNPNLFDIDDDELIDDVPPIDEFTGFDDVDADDDDDF
jgi:hypothetical protein